ncbi:MAG: hypothetical protein AAF798_22665 [Bacteroidota bacterium]
MNNRFKLVVEPFSTSLTAVLIRFYLMMAVVIIALFSGQAWLAVLSLPIFLSALLGLKVVSSAQTATRSNAQVAPTTVATTTAKAA